MYKVHQDAVRLNVNYTTKKYIFNGEELPAVSVSASTDSTGVVHISAVNIDAHNPQKLTFNVNALQKINNVSGRILTSPKLQDHNSFVNADKVRPVEFKGASLKDNHVELDIPPFSVIVLELK